MLDMTGEPNRPSNTVPLKILCNMVLIPNMNDEIEYYKVDSRGYPTPTKAAYAKKEVTIIVGHREPNNLLMTPADLVFTGVFGTNGRISSVGKELEGQELTIIIHNVE